MYHFQCDYSEGAHPRILERLQETNMEQTVGYGEDKYCLDAALKIGSAIVFFLQTMKYGKPLMLKETLVPMLASVGSWECVEKGLNTI